MDNNKTKNGIVNEQKNELEMLNEQLNILRNDVNNEQTKYKMLQHDHEQSMERLKQTFDQELRAFEQDKKNNAEERNSLQLLIKNLQQENVSIRDTNHSLEDDKKKVVDENEQLHTAKQRLESEKLLIEQQSQAIADTEKSLLNEKEQIQQALKRLTYNHTGDTLECVTFLIDKHLELEKELDDLKSKPSDVDEYKARLLEEEELTKRLSKEMVTLKSTLEKSVSCVFKFFILHR